MYVVGGGWWQNFYATDADGARGTTIFCDVSKVDFARLFSCAFSDERLMERALLLGTANVLSLAFKIPG